MNTPLENDIAKRFGILPNFFRLASSDPTITSNLWGFARFAYLDNPLPSLLKERLFVYLSRFCEIRYCIARHVGFLTGLGYPAGYSSCLPQRVEVILPLLRRPLPLGEDLLPLLAVCAGFDSPLSSFPEPDSPGEQALFACATHVFLQTPEAPQAQEALVRALGPLNLEQLNLLLAFVRTAHYWTKLHPALAFEDDISDLLVTHETLAQCILKDPEAQKDSLGRQVAAELTSLRKLRRQHESMTGRLLQAQEEERKRISRELHDDLSQKVALLAFDTSNLVLALPSSREELTKSLRNLQIRTAGLATDIRKIAHQLHPSILDDIGLGAALRELCHEFSGGEAFEVVFEQKALVEGNLPMDVASCLYRVAQEALYNVVKHARASQVWLTVSGSPDNVFLCIRDNGVGFDSDATASGQGLGVISMKERVRLVQGDLCIESQPGRGTTLIVSVALPRSHNAAPASTLSG